MKELLIALSLLVGGVVLEAPAPYPPSGWKPSGVSFDLPKRIPQSEYLPVEPRNPTLGDDDVDVSVQGLPTGEQQPIFQLSPVNGQQYSGPSVNADISRLNPSLQQAQYQQQLQIAREFARQREYEAAVARQAANQPRYQPPGSFGQTTTSTIKPILRTPQEGTTTEPLDLNEGEILDDGREPRKQPEKVTVEITKQNLQEYPAEIFLNPFAQLKGQAQFVPLQQLGQLQNGPLILQQVQAEPQGFDGPAHFSALPSVLAQRELLQQTPQAQNFVQNPIIVQEPLAQPVSQYQPINQYQPSQPEIQAQYQPVQPQPAQYQPGPQIPVQYSPAQPQIQPAQYALGQPQIQPQYQPIQPQFQPQGQYQPVQPQMAGQYQPQVFLPQNPINQYQPADPKDVEQIEPTNTQQQIGQPQFFQQPNQAQQPQIGQPQFFQQPNQAQQPQIGQPQFFQQPNQAQPQIGQPQFFQQPNQIAQPQFFQQPNQAQPQIGQPQFLQQPDQAQPQIGQQVFQPNQAQLIIAQPINYQNQDLEQFYQLQSQRQTQGGLQSGLNINQQGNDIDEKTEDQPETEEGTKAVAVATAFGTRTQPRAQYGAPVPRGQSPRRTTESPQDEQVTEDTPAIAEATAVASGRRNARLRSRRVRPVFTIDKSGHLVLAQQ